MSRNITVSGIYVTLCQHPDEMGDFLKNTENQVPPNNRFVGGKPLVVRLDGSSFSKFTKDLDYPFDDRYREAMVTTMQQLAEYYSANICYTQSDEITLVWSNCTYISRDGYTKNLPFDGRYQKILSEVASKCGALFNENLHRLIPQKKEYAHFDCRAYQPQTDDEMLLSLRWRIIDCQKNAVNQCLRSVDNDHHKYDGVSSRDRVEVLRQFGFDWDGLNPDYKHGTLLYKAKRMCDVKSLESIPEQYRPTGPILRSTWVKSDVVTQLGNLDSETVYDVLYNLYDKKRGEM